MAGGMIQEYRFNTTGGVSSVSFIDTPTVSSGGAAWGDITGTLSEQADVYAAITSRALAATISSAAFTISSMYAISTHLHSIYASSTHNISSATHSFPGGETVFLRGDGTFAVPAGGAASPISTVYVTSIKNTTTTSSLPLPEMQFTVSSGLRYSFDFGIVYASRISSTGLRVGLQYPSASTFAANVEIPAVVAVGTDSRTQGYISTSGGSVVAPSTPLASTQYLANVYGMILPSANGTLQLTYATEVAGSAISTFVGGYGILTTL